MAWIESHQDLAHHPKVTRLAKTLAVSVPTTIGHLHCLWWWCLSYAANGDITRFTDFEIALAAQWDGEPTMFVEALAEAGWVDKVKRRKLVHDWYEYGGKLAERRRADAERKRVARSKDVPGTSSGRPPPVQRRQQHTTQQKTTAATFEAFHAERCAEAVKERRRKGLEVKSDSGLQQVYIKDPVLRAESHRLWTHRDCAFCNGSGQIAYHPQAGGTTYGPCEEPA